MNAEKLNKLVAELNKISKEDEYTFSVSESGKVEVTQTKKYTVAPDQQKGYQVFYALRTIDDAIKHFESEIKMIKMMEW